MLHPFWPPGARLGGPRGCLTFWVVSLHRIAPEHAAHRIDSTMSQAAKESHLTFGMVQMKPRKGDVEANLEHVRSVLLARSPEHDVLVFPEACLTGYFLEGAVAETALTVDDVASRLGEPPAQAADLVIGFYERWRRQAYNSVAYFAADGACYRPKHVHRKMFLPTYGVFDEARFVETGRDLRAFDTRFGRFGMLICEEMWHSLPATVLALDGAEAILVPSASPARGFAAERDRPANLDRWDAIAPGAANEHGVFVIVSQLVGSEGGKLFAGGSLAVGPDGSVLARGPLLDEGVTTVTIDVRAIDRARFESPLLADLQQMLPHLQETLSRAGRDGHRLEADVRCVDAPDDAGSERRSTPGPHDPMPGDASILELNLPLVERTLVEFIREEVVRRRGFEKVVIGVSGGVDSSVSLFLAVRALGPENVTGLRLPYATSSPESLEHAAMVLKATGAEGRTLDITGAVDAYVALHEPDITPLRRGNLAARFRALTLFDQSARLNALPLGTGNKSERLLGYYTWHADDSPPINPLGDLYKTQVWALARHLDVPEEIVEKPASADLVQGIHDEDELGISYHEADLILHWYLKGYPREDLVRCGFPEAKVKLVWDRLNATHWKRELPTVAVLSSSAIGEFYLRPVDY